MDRSVGITFVISWTASVVNWLWEKQFTRQQFQRWSLIYVSIMMLVLLHGWIRLMFVTNESPTVRIATVVPSTERMFAMLPGEGFVQKLLAGTTISNDEEQIVRESFQDLAVELFHQSAEAAQDGAQVILWPEAVIWALGSDRDTLIAQGQAFAQEH